MAATLANFQLTPDLRHRCGKFKGNVTAVCRACPNRYDDTLFRLVVSLVRHHQSLSGSDTTRHRNQSAVSIDQDREGFFVEWIATQRAPVNEHRNMDGNTTRPAAIRTISARHLGGTTVRALGKERSGPPQYRENFTCKPHSVTRWLEDRVKNNYSRF